MELRGFMLPAAESAVAVVQNVPAEALDGPTPCPSWDVRGLINHLIAWVGPGETAARKQPPPGGKVDEDHDHVADGDWATQYAEQARRTAEAWNDPAAWEGDTSLSGNPQGMPAPMIGAMLLGEYVMHGWDLAAATGQKLSIPDELAQALYEHTVPFASMAREYEAFGAEVKVPESAPPLDRLLGLTGRDPSWRP